MILGWVACVILRVRKMTIDLTEIKAAPQLNPYIPCSYQRYEPCKWGWGNGLIDCGRCPVTKSLGVPDVGYSFAPSPLGLRYEMVCYSPHSYVDECDIYYAEINGYPNWSQQFNKLYHHLEDWLRNKKNTVRVNSNYRKCLDMLLANFILADDANRQLLIPKKRESSVRRNPQDLGYKVVQLILGYLKEHRLIYEMTGPADQNYGGATWYIPSKRLLDQLNRNEVSARLHPETLLLDYKKYRADTKKWVTVRLPEQLLETARNLQLPAQAHASVWRNHAATLYGKRINPDVWRVFNGSLDAGGRFYGSFQNIKREDRQAILIDSEETVEPDFTAFHIYILYANQGLQCHGDPYFIDGFDRETVKSVGLMMMNHESRSRFIGQITRSGNPETKSLYLSHNNLAKTYRLNGHKPPQKPEKLKGFIENIPDNQDGSELLEAVENAHPLISDSLFIRGLGLSLQFQDSQIMASMLSELSNMGIPVLPIHDSVRCKKSDKNSVIEVMQNSYQELTGFDCSVV